MNGSRPGQTLKWGLFDRVWNADDLVDTKTVHLHLINFEINNDHYLLGVP